jgi:hypothetical protein
MRRGGREHAASITPTVVRRRPLTQTKVLLGGALAAVLYIALLLTVLKGEDPVVGDIKIFRNMLKDLHEDANGGLHEVATFILVSRQGLSLVSTDVRYGPVPSAVRRPWYTWQGLGRAALYGRCSLVFQAHHALGWPAVQASRMHLCPTVSDARSASGPYPHSSLRLPPSQAFAEARAKGCPRTALQILPTPAAAARQNDKKGATGCSGHSDAPQVTSRLLRKSVGSLTSDPTTGMCVPRMGPTGGVRGGGSTSLWEWR